MAHHDIRTRAFWTDTGERVAVTFLQVLIPALGIEAGVTGLHEVKFVLPVSIAAAAALASLLKCLLAGLSNGTASMVPPAEVKAKRERLQADLGQAGLRPGGEHDGAGDPGAGDPRP